MAVNFRRDTSLTQARHSLIACRNDPVVIRTSPPVKAGGFYVATVVTRRIGDVTPPASRLTSCLRRQPDVVGAAWPD